MYSKQSKLKVYIFAISFLGYLKSGRTQCSSRIIGENNPLGKSGDVDSNSNTGYILFGLSDYVVDCCGSVTQWNVVASGSGTVYFQVWRPGTGSDYTLIGENAETVTTGIQSPAISVSSGNQISTRPGDVIGWYASGANLVEYKDAGGSPSSTTLAMSKPTIGQTVSWGGGTTLTGRTYAIQAVLNGGSSPSIDSPANGATYSLINDAAVGYSIETITWSDVDAGDELTVVMTTNAKFNFDNGTGALTVASSLSGPSSTESLTFTVTDFCGNSDSITIQVNIINEPPILYGLPDSYSLLEDTTSETLLHTINATDSADPVTCSFSGAVTDPFTVKVIPGTSTYGIYSNSSPNFDYDTTNQYTLPVVCSDGYSSTSTGNFYVYLVKNQAPVIHNLQGATTLSTAAGIGTNVFTVNATDFEGDTLAFNMTCDPTPCPFQIFASGEIQLNADISTYTTVGYDIAITVSDAKNTVGPKTLTVIIQDINDPVLITNLPLTSSYPVPENTPLSTSVFAVSFSDQDTQTWTFSMSSTPAAGLSYFSLNSGGVISTTGTSLDYETLAIAGTTSFTLTINVNDGTASDTDPLVIDIIDVNEAPQFPQSTYSLSATEGAAGASAGTPSFGVRDEDTGESQMYTMDCGANTAYFLMNSSTGEVTYQSNYDLGSGLSSTVPCTVTVEDNGGLTDTATLNIYISESNDNTPVFFPASYSFFISYYSSVGSAVGTVTATDGDTGSFGALAYAIDQVSLLDEYFTVDGSGQISVLKSPSPLGFSTIVTINVTATDGGGLSGIASVTIGIGDTTTTSTTTTTDRFKTFLEDGRNVAWLVACILVLMVIAGILVWLIGTCRGDNSFQAFKRQFCKKRKKVWRPRLRRKRRREPSFQSPNKRSSEFLSVRHPPPPKGEQAWRSALPDLIK